MMKIVSNGEIKLVNEITISQTEVQNMKIKDIVPKSFDVTVIEAGKKESTVRISYVFKDQVDMNEIAKIAACIDVILDIITDAATVQRRIHAIKKDLEHLVSHG